MTFHVGTDIVEVNRIKDAIMRNDLFRNRVFSEMEIDYCEGRGKSKFQSYAGKFSAKEAVYKALCNYINFDYKYTDFEILNYPDGKPYVKLNFKIEQLDQIDISISHSRDYAVCNAIAIIKN